MGVKWGTALLDPSFRQTTADLVGKNVVEPTFANRPANYDDAETLKTIVLMTDGQNSDSNRISQSAYNSSSEYAHWAVWNFPYYLYNYVPKKGIISTTTRANLHTKATQCWTRSVMTHNQIKDKICANAGNVGDCAATLRLEMVTVNPRDFQQLNQNIDCVDKSLPAEPERGFTLGKRHELMMLRACLKINPMLVGSGLGFKFDTDGSGQASMFAISSFVQEPN